MAHTSVPSEHIVSALSPDKPTSTHTQSDISLSCSVFADLGCDVKLAQKNDPDIQEVLTWVANGNCPRRSRLRNLSRTTRRLWLDFSKLAMIDGILCRMSRPVPGKSPVQQVIIPQSLQSMVLAHLHGDKLAGHFSAQKTFQRSLTICYWPYIRRDIEAYCRTCRECESRRNPTPRNKAPMQVTQANTPFQRIFADITELPITSKRNRYILVVMDQFTKYVNLFPLQDQTAHTVAKCLFDKYICEHGIPEFLHTDQGRQFDCALIHTLCKLVGINKTRTSPYHPQSDGLVERFNRSLKDQLSKYLLSTPGEWDDVLHQVQFAYNSAVHSSTGFSPFYLAKGREPRLPANVIVGSPASTSHLTPDSYATSLQTRLKSAFNQVAHSQERASLSQKSHYDKKTKFNPYNTGDLVWLDDPANSRVKLAPRWKGPFRIVSLHSSDDQEAVTYSIVDCQDPNGKTKRVHYNRLKPYISPLPPVPSLPQQSVIPPLTPTALSGSLPLPVPPLSPTLPLPPVSPLPPVPPTPLPSLRPSPTYSIPHSTTTGKTNVTRTRSGRVVACPNRLGF